MEQHQQKHSSRERQLRAVIVTLEQTVTQQNETIAVQQEETAHLKYRLVDLRRMIFGSKSERFISTVCPTQYPIEFAVNSEFVGAIVDEARTQITYTRKSAVKKHEGRVVDFPAHLPVEVSVIEPEEDTTGMTCIGREITKELELIPASFFVRQYERPKYCTPEAADGSVRVIIADLPQRPIDKCMAGVDLLTAMIVDKQVYSSPDYRQIQRWKRMGVDISASTLGSWQRNLSELFSPLYDVMRSVVLQSSYLQVDETPLAVQDRTKQGTTHKGWLWAYNAPVVKIVFFDYQTWHGEIHCRELLENFCGYLKTDNYLAYDKHKRREDNVGVACWAHARRYFEKALDDDRSRASTAMTLIQQLYEVEATARQNALTYAERQDLRMRHALSVALKFFTWMEHQLALPKSPLGKAIAYAMRLKNELMVYISDGRLEIDNNLVENAIRPVAIGR